MTIKEAILKVLENNVSAFNYKEVLKKINEQNYIDWSNAKTPADTIGATLGDFIRQHDTRVKRVKGTKGFLYYFATYEKQLNFSKIVSAEKNSKQQIAKKYLERDLHTLLSSYLKNKGIYTKTILHEKSANSKDKHQKWIHPDMLGIQFLQLKNTASEALLHEVNKAATFTLISYEIKREIKTDYDLKEYFFQTVSNSSWANYGYLVAFEISKNLLEEMERLHQSFGIGIIELKANPYESDVLFPAVYKDLDFKTIDKLCEVNTDFKNFITQTKNILTAPKDYKKATKIAFENFCDSYLKTDTEIENYCKEKNIPTTPE